MRCSLRYERALYKTGVKIVAGIDEAGRGPLAGPVVAAAVILPGKFRHPLLTDSKQLSAKERDEIFSELTSPEAAEKGVRWQVASIEPLEIDRINILRATHQAMRCAVAALDPQPDHVLIDGLAVRPFPVAQTPLVKGDAKSFSIAAASVIAKVTRDRLMQEADLLYPVYLFGQHKGYATAEHLERLREHGPCPLHRRTFLPSPEKQLDLF